MSADSRQARMLARLAEVECPAFQHRRRSREGGSHGPSPILLTRGEGSYVWDANYKRYVDLVAGFGSVLLGHRHPSVQRAIAEQTELLTQGLGDVYASDVKLALLEALAAIHPSGDAQVLLAQSGGDAITAAMKTATLATGRSGFLAFDGAYHGLGFAPLAVCGYRNTFRVPFADQLSSTARFAPFPGVRGATANASLDMVREQLDDSVAAVIIEPILGRGGCVVPPPGFLAEVAELARARGALVIADEIWTGLGRTGSLLCASAEQVVPDILCLGKGLGGGLSIAACVATRSVMSGWTRADTVHTSTHAGAPLPCATALATMATIARERLVRRAGEVGDRVRTALADKLGGVATIHGRGLMIGIALAHADVAQHAMAALLNRGFLVITGGIGGEVLTLTPALTIDEEVLTSVGDVLLEVLEGAPGT